MTIDGHRTRRPPSLPTALPPVERRATIPAGFRAGGAAAGIKASGRPDLAIIATLADDDGRPDPPRPRRSSPRTPSRPRRSACRRPISRRAVAGRDGDRLDERLRQRRDRAPPATRTRPRSPRLLAAALGVDGRADARSCRPGSSGRACRSTVVGRRDRRARAVTRGDRRRARGRGRAPSGRPTPGRRPRRRR